MGTDVTKAVACLKSKVFSIHNCVRLARTFGLKCSCGCKRVGGQVIAGGGGGGGATTALSSAGLRVWFDLPSLCLFLSSSEMVWGPGVLMQTGSGLSVVGGFQSDPFLSCEVCLITGMRPRPLYVKAGVSVDWPQISGPGLSETRSADGAPL